MASEQQASAEAIVRELFDEWSTGRPTSEVYERAFAPGFVCHGPPGVNHSHEAGNENCMFYIFNTSFEGLSFTVDQLSAEAERVVARFTVRGRQVAEFAGIKPRGHESTFTGLTILRVADGKIAEGWGTVNWA